MDEPHVERVLGDWVRSALEDPVSDRQTPVHVGVDVRSSDTAHATAGAADARDGMRHWYATVRLSVSESASEGLDAAQALSGLADKLQDARWQIGDGLEARWRGTDDVPHAQTVQAPRGLRLRAQATFLLYARATREPLASDAG